MGKRVYKGDDGNYYPTKADALGAEIAFNLKNALGTHLGIETDADFSMTTEAADSLIAAIRPFSTKKTYPNRKPRSDRGQPRGKKGDNK